MDEQLISDMTRIHYNSKKNNTDIKKCWYRLGERLMNRTKLGLRTESAVEARRTYHYYTEDYGNWIGPSPRQFSKMNRQKFALLLEGRKEVNGVTLISEGESLSRLPSLPRSHVTGHVTGTSGNGSIPLSANLSIDPLSPPRPVPLSPQ